jgi:ribosomal protein S18 acetylase RimI-like enzyme
MLELRPARPEDQADAEALWTLVFGDKPAMQREFYRLCGVEGPLVLREEGAVRAMLALPETDLVFPDGWSVRTGYVYALATHPDARGRGLAGALLAYAADLGRRRGLDCLVTVPAQPSLFDFFARNGYVPGFYHRRVLADPIPGPSCPVSPEEYAQLRSQLLAGTTHLAQDAGHAAFQQALCAGRGGLFRLTLPHGPALAAVEDWPDGAVVKELLCAPEDEGEGVAVAAGLCRHPAVVRLPGTAANGMPFGAIHWLHAAPAPRWRAAPEGYLGLAFD